MYPTFVIFLIHTQRSFMDSYGSIHLATAGHIQFASPPTPTQENSGSLTGDNNSVAVLDQVSRNAEIRARSIAVTRNNKTVIGHHISAPF